MVGWSHDFCRPHRNQFHECRLATQHVQIAAGYPCHEGVLPPPLPSLRYVRDTSPSGEVLDSCTVGTAGRSLSCSMRLQLL